VAKKGRSSSSLLVLFGSKTNVPLSRANSLGKTATTATTSAATTTTRKTVTTTTTSASTATMLFSGTSFLERFCTYPSYLFSEA
jgi:hypothetical protein